MSGYLNLGWINAAAYLKSVASMAGEFDPRPGIPDLQIKCGFEYIQYRFQRLFVKGSCYPAITQPFIG